MELESRHRSTFYSPSIRSIAISTRAWPAWLPHPLAWRATQAAQRLSEWHQICCFRVSFGWSS